MQQRERVAQLSKVPLFANCSKRELARLLSRVRTEDVEADTPIDWLVLNRASLRKAIDEVPGLGWSLLQAVAARLDQANKRLV